MGSNPTHSFSNLIGSSLTMSSALIGRALETWAESAASSGFVSPSGRIFPRRHKRISPADQQDLRNSELGVWYGKASNPKFKKLSFATQRDLPTLSEVPHLLLIFNVNASQTIQNYDFKNIPEITQILLRDHSRTLREHSLHLWSTPMYRVKIYF